MLEVTVGEILPGIVYVAGEELSVTYEVQRVCEDYVDVRLVTPVRDVEAEDPGVTVTIGMGTTLRFYRRLPDPYTKIRISGTTLTFYLQEE